MIVVRTEKLIHAFRPFGAIFIAIFLRIFLMVCGGLLGQKEGLALHEERLDRKLVNEPNALVYGMVHVDSLFLNQDVDVGLIAGRLLLGRLLDLALIV